MSDTRTTLAVGDCVRLINDPGGAIASGTIGEVRATGTTSAVVDFGGEIGIATLRFEHLAASTSHPTPKPRMVPTTQTTGELNLRYIPRPTPMPEPPPGGSISLAEAHKMAVDIAKRAEQERRQAAQEEARRDAVGCHSCGCASRRRGW